MIILVMTVTALISCNSARHTVTGQNDVYKGTWQHQNGNRLFIVSLWSDGEYTKGHYKMVETNNGVPGDLIFTSRKYYGNGFYFPPVITGLYDSQYGLSGSFSDNTISGYTKDFKSGVFVMKIIPQSNPATATWKVEEAKGLKTGVQPSFSIPTDIILTKVSNEVDLD